MYSIPVLIDSNVEHLQNPKGSQQILGWEKGGVSEPIVVEKRETKFHLSK
jgi:hypothetical protein